MICHKEFDKTCHTCKDTLIAKLREEVKGWKQVWFQSRDIIGKATWMIPPPGYLKKEEQKKFKRMAQFIVNQCERCEHDLAPVFEPTLCLECCVDELLKETA